MSAAGSLTDILLREGLRLNGIELESSSFIEEMIRQYGK
jgi:hypothetical protein